MSLLAVTVLAVFGSSVHACDKEALYSTCLLEANPNIPNNITGHIYLKQEVVQSKGPTPVLGDIKYVDITEFEITSADCIKTIISETCKYDKIKLHVTINGMDLDPDMLKHGFHVHAFGNLIGGCEMTGPHYNILGTLHGGLKDSKTDRHVGDWGNVKQKKKTGVVEAVFSDKISTLHGANNIVGRAIVLHQLKDDLGRKDDPGSQSNGNAGPRMACCVVGVSAPFDTLGLPYQIIY